MARKPKERTGDRAVRLGFITSEQLDVALSMQSERKVLGKPHLPLGMLFLDQEWIGSELPVAANRRRLLAAAYGAGHRPRQGLDADPIAIEAGPAAPVAALKQHFALTQELHGTPQRVVLHRLLGEGVPVSADVRVGGNPGQPGVERVGRHQRPVMDDALGPVTPGR